MSRAGKTNISIEAKAEMVAALPELGTQLAVAKAFGVSRPVVSRALGNPQAVQLARIKKHEIAQGFGDLVDRLLKRYRDLADGATLDDKGVTLLGICADKFLLYNDEPTEIAEYRHRVTREEAEGYLANWLPLFNGDRKQAIAALCEVDPECAPLLLAAPAGAG